ncbi:protein of unassigned function [Methylobacterium oryzae CBMB20]|uniref:Protein of unassigned function n=1 Tax=Methylobacterium oryzae CBMB20 TaxID=693986 RepID=A0A089NMQ2_9HYPH|nr:protein of unassigned function [Methylobacterium oryzae CBMB20]
MPGPLLYDTRSRKRAALARTVRGRSIAGGQASAGCRRDRYRG